MLVFALQLSISTGPLHDAHDASCCQGSSGSLAHFRRRPLSDATPLPMRKSASK